MGDYSLAFGGLEPYENYYDFQRALMYSATADEYQEKISKIETYYTFGQNFLFAYDSGDIGYFLGA